LHRASSARIDRRVATRGAPIPTGATGRFAADIARLLTGGRAGQPFGPPAERLLVVGALRSGQPLNGELTTRGARLADIVQTAPEYRLYRLDTEPEKPGLVRVAGGGESIQGELWELPVAALGSLLATLPPMALGRVGLADGSETTGFLCEPVALEGAKDISAHGSWLEYLGRV